jgi:hypothetical protein
LYYPTLLDVAPEFVFPFGLAKLFVFQVSDENTPSQSVFIDHLDFGIEYVYQQPLCHPIFVA